MKTLVLHSANIDIIRKFCEKYNKDDIYVCTNKKNAGMFLNFAREIYLENDFLRIDSFKIIDEIRNYILELNIEQLIFITSNVNGENYENIEVLYNSIDFDNKILFNSKLERINFKRKFDTYLNELFYENEDVVLNEYTNINKECKKKTEFKKIMFIYDSLYMGGVTNLIYEWIKKMKDKFEIIFSCYSNGAQFYKYENLDDIKLYVYKESIFESNATLDYHHYLNRIMEMENPDAIFISGVSTFLPSMIAAIDSNISRIYPIANISYYEIFGSTNIGKYLRIFERHYTKIIAVSNAVKKSIVNLGVSKDKIEVIYGTSINLNNIKYDDSKKINKKIISCICRLSKEKGVDTLIDAISKIDLDKYNDFEVYIVGDGEEKDNLMNLSSNLNLNNVIKFLGYRDDIENILGNTYISVLPSHHEGLPLSILESMAYGKMVIATNVDGIPEVIEHGNNGFLINENDVNMLAEYIKKCLSDEDLVKRMNYNAHKLIVEKFNVDVCTNKIIELIMEE